MYVLLSLLILAADPPKPAAAWVPKDKEIVVLLGSGFIEQEARDGYLETELIRLFPNKDIRIRNLGWSGDTVYCQARSYFGPPQEGFDRLREHLKMIKPTTVICCYGANESWKGEPGIPDFRKGYEKLIDMIREATGATVVLMTPPPSQTAEKAKLGFNPEEMLKRYWQETKYVAESKKVLFANFGDAAVEALDNQGTGYLVNCREHYEAIAIFLSATLLGSKFGVDQFQELFKASILTANGKTKSIEQLVTSPMLAQHSWFQLERNDLKLRLMIDGATTRFRPSFRDFQTYYVDDGPDQKQLERLRQAIKKNALFFHRWRPANETYLYGFRKHEQGNNGVEPPQFDKLVEQAEAEIAKLKKPVPHKYELIRIEK